MEYGNLAYKLPEQYDEPIKKKTTKEKRKTVNTTAVSNKRNHEQMQYKENNFSWNMRDSAFGCISRIYDFKIRCCE